MRKVIRDSDKLILFITIVLSLFGLFNIVTASSREAVINLDQSIYYYFYRHLIILVASLVATIVVIATPLKKYYKFIPLLVFGIIGLNIFLIVQGTTTRGASNWIDLGFFNLQPSEIAKPIMIIALSFYLEKFSKVLASNKVSHTKYIIILLATSLPLILLVVLQKDLGTAIILAMIFISIFLTSPILSYDKLKTIFIGGIVLVVGVLGYVIVKGNPLTKAQLSRFDYRNPCANYATNGYQICNAFIAINKGGAFGLGIGKSTQKYSYIPEPHTDMVFSIISEENGLVGGSLIFLCYIVLIYRILRLARLVDSIKNRYLCIGVATYIFMHIAINLGGLFGLIPLTGVPLPFLSYGGSFTLSLLISIALVQRVCIETKKVR